MMVKLLLAKYETGALLQHSTGITIHVPPSLCSCDSGAAAMRRPGRIKSWAPEKKKYVQPVETVSS